MGGRAGADFESAGGKGGSREFQRLGRATRTRAGRGPPSKDGSDAVARLMDAVYSRNSLS